MLGVGVRVSLGVQLRRLLMKPYGIDSKIKKNFRDYHPKKGYQNWWEDFHKVIKARERRKNKCFHSSIG